MIHQKTFTDGRMPLCFKPAQWEAWKEIARECPVDLNGLSCCADCTPDFQRQMKREGRCEYPNIRFLVDDSAQFLAYLQE